MEWTHSETIGLSNVKCTKCEGTGLTAGTHRDGKSPCNCVLRNIFRACLRRFYFCAAKRTVSQQSDVDALSRL